MAKKKRSKRETIRGMAGDGYLDPALWADPDFRPDRPAEETADDEVLDEDREDGDARAGEGS